MNAGNPEDVNTMASALFRCQQIWDDPFSFHSEYTWEGLCREHPEEAMKFRTLAIVAIVLMAALKEFPREQFRRTTKKV